MTEPDLRITVSRCKYCGRKMAHAIDENGKRQVLDLVAPVYEIDEEDEANPTANVCRRNRRAFVSHFVTCPKRDEARPKR